MAKQDYMPNDDEAKAALFLHVRDTLPQFFTTLGLTVGSPEVVAQSADAAVFDFLLKQQQRLLAAAQSSTAAKKRLRDGDPAQPNLVVDLSFPSAPGTVPSPRIPGVVPRFRVFVKFLRGRTGFTEPMAEALKITGDETSAPDLATIQPQISVRMKGGQPEIVWTKNGMTALEIDVDRGDTQGWRFLTIDSVPNYLDTQAMPAAPAKWKYRAIYRLKDERVGQWSAVVEAMVG